MDNHIKTREEVNRFMKSFSSTDGTVTIGIDYFVSILEELNERRATMSALANILDCTVIPDKNIKQILRGEQIR